MIERRHGMRSTQMNRRDHFEQHLTDESTQTTSRRLFRRAWPSTNRSFAGQTSFVLETGGRHLCPSLFWTPAMPLTTKVRIESSFDSCKAASTPSTICDVRDRLKTKSKRFSSLSFAAISSITLEAAVRTKSRQRPERSPTFNRKCRPVNYSSAFRADSSVTARTLASHAMRRLVTENPAKLFDSTIHAGLMRPFKWNLLHFKWITWICLFANNALCNTLPSTGKTENSIYTFLIAFNV